MPVLSFISLTIYIILTQYCFYEYEGHETTATLCVWAIYCLIQNPRVQALVLDDILNHAPKEGQITLESLEKMAYFEAFLNEVLRLYPP